ncbi:MAG: hypothetical protein J6Y14_10900 [Fibrobacter sp.]|nr:hypothetical protein [Fibrobacter sp.]
MIKIFNSVFEISLRIICILGVSKKPLSKDMIELIDFIATYGKDFDVATTNLHGENSYRKSEVYVRNALISKGVKEMVLEGFVEFNPTKIGFLYCLSPDGTRLFESMNDEYAYEFSVVVKDLVDKSIDELNRIVKNN